MVLALAPMPVRASPLEDSTTGGATFTGPAHAHATAIYVNPAALGLIGQGWHFYAGGSLRLDSYHIQRMRITDPSAGPEPGPAMSTRVPAPGGTVAGYNVGQTASLAVAFGLPWYQESLATGAQGQDTDIGYHTLGGVHRQYWVSFATSFRVNQRLIVGTGLALTSTLFELSFLRDTAIEQGTPGVTGDCNGAPCGIENPYAAERYDVSVSSSGFLGTQNLAINAGFVYQVAQDWWVGMSYQSSSGLQAPLQLQGSVDVTPSPRDMALGRQPFDAKAEVTYRLPQTLWLGVRGPVARDLEIVAAARWQSLSKYRQYDIRIFDSDVSPTTPEWYPRFTGLRDVYTFEAGAEGMLLPQLKLGGRLRYETGATATQDISPTYVEGTQLGWDMGGELRLFDNRLAIEAGYAITWFPTARVTQSNFDPLSGLACVDSGYDIDACSATAQGRAIPTALGTYERTKHAIRLSVRYSFL